MGNNFFNVYEDTVRADSYASLEFPNTYYLAYRDLPEIISKHVNGKKALDFGCGAGRSTRFLMKLGFECVGVDISNEMIKKAKEFDTVGIYECIVDGDFSKLAKHSFDLIQSIFTFDNIPNKENRAKLLTGLSSLLKPDGRIILLDAAPENYWYEWASFTTKAFPENKTAKSGDFVKIVMKDVADNRPVLDLLWFNEDYLELFNSASLRLIDTIRPLGKNSEPYNWISETTIAPWVIYVLAKE